MMAALRCVMLAAIVCGFAARPFAHDLERTEVTLTFEADGSFVLDVANDPDWLLLRLEPFAVDAGITGPAVVSPAIPNDIVKRDARLASIAPVVIDRVVLWVDGREVRPTSAEFIRPRPQTPADDLSPLGVYRLRGRMPTDARSLRWFYGIVIDPYPMTVRRADGRVLKETILGKAWSETIDLAGQFEPRSPLNVISEYFVLGYRHVFARGLDHLLFVLGLLLLSRRFQPVMAQVAAFTVGQAIAILSTIYGLMAAPGRAIWPIILLSIAYVLVENLLARKLTFWRLAFVFVFGLFHGVELAAALTAVGVPRARTGWSVLAFNAGVIAAELTVVVAVMMAVAALRGSRPADVQIRRA
jgi:HupE / UreJ protein